MNADAHEVLVTDLKGSKFAVSRAGCFLVRYGFGCSGCLAEKGSNPLGVLNRIDFIDSKSHEVKR